MLSAWQVICWILPTNLWDEDKWFFQVHPAGPQTSPTSDSHTQDRRDCLPSKRLFHLIWFWKVLSVWNHIMAAELSSSLSPSCNGWKNSGLERLNDWPDVTCRQLSEWNWGFLTLCPGFVGLYTILLLPLNCLGIMQCVGFSFFSWNNESVQYLLATSIIWRLLNGVNMPQFGISVAET